MNIFMLEKIEEEAITTPKLRTINRMWNYNVFLLIICIELHTKYINIHNCIVYLLDLVDHFLILTIDNIVLNLFKIKTK